MLVFVLKQMLTAFLHTCVSLAPKARMRHLKLNYIALVSALFYAVMKLIGRNVIQGNATQFIIDKLSQFLVIKSTIEFFSNYTKLAMLAFKGLHEGK